MALRSVLRVSPRIACSFAASLSTMKPHHVLTMFDLSSREVDMILNHAKKMKANPEHFSTVLKDKTLLMIFEKPSLRTRVSFETGMTQMGGHGIYYNMSDSPLGKKESYSDTGKVISRYVDAVIARVKSREQVRGLAQYATIPVINALDDFAHPCQILTDLLTITEKKGGLKGIKMAYFGDCKNNMTYDLMRGATLMGFDISVAGPKGKDYEVTPDVIESCKKMAAKTGSKVVITHDAYEAVKDADVVYTDSWMSYGVPKAEEEARKKVFMPYQVNQALMRAAKKDAIFMNCLPAMRGMEQTAEVIDGKQSVVFDQAENRLHSQKALLQYLLVGI